VSARRSTPARREAAGTSRAPRFASRHIVLAAIVAVAAVLRLVRIGHSPPGLNQDEAIGAWISWCLLKTGHDMSGVPWPIFYAHGIGDNPSTLFFYLTLPFQALGGLNVLTTRLPAALAGILCIPLIYWVGKRLFGTAIGLVAAAMLALNPWHLFLSRFGVGASQCPLHALAIVALLLAARFPLADSPGGPPRAGFAALAGLAAGISCYGFHAMRLWVPLLLLGLVVIAWRSWWALLASGAGRVALAAFVLALGATAGPLAWRQVVDPALSQRWQMTRLWEPGAGPAEILRLVSLRYLDHFGLDYLFLRGDLYELMKPIGQGEFHWPMLPAMLAGLVLAVSAARSRRAARVLLVLVAIYPAGDLISRYLSVHSLRSAPGLPALVLLAGFGAVGAGRALWRRRPQLARGVAVAAAIAVVFVNVRFLSRFFGEYDRRPEIYHGYFADLVEATAWLKPKLPDVDAVFCTVSGMNEPFAVTLVGLGYDPERWFREPRDRRAFDYDIYVRYGKMHFMYRDFWVPELNALEANGRVDRVLFIVRPGELHLSDPLYTVRGPDGRDVLWICGREL
jgi:4-amino-4-deoxy-L-arabinose transferase-like glycosyltransferase